MTIVACAPLHRTSAPAQAAAPIRPFYGRILYWKPDARYTAGERVARRVRRRALALSATGSLTIDLVCCASTADLLAELPVHADFVMLTGHSWWHGGRPTHLLGNDLHVMAGLIDADAVVLDSCWMATCPADVAALLARPTPVVACDEASEFRKAPLLLGPLLADLAAQVPITNWPGAVGRALTAAQAVARTQVRSKVWQAWRVV
ncbi:hypothetical protein [Streptacidiphilus anmyonensis]|uniref:hypothetical protein n=1 Tax=Streptacidiphilus anmyonensis TaxID=405782 RepID=UPI0005A93C5C|nr:hypothetical protein [Streptacidiphilus anmyonensis]